jgi:hypothetical protein
VTHEALLGVPRRAYARAMLSLRAPVFLAASGLALASAGCFLTGGPLEAEGSGGGAGSSTGGSSTGTTDPGPGGTGGTGGTGGATTTTTTTTTDPACMQSCDDANPCTADACQAGTCVNEPVSDGSALEDLDLKDCKKPVCHGGVITDDPDPNQVPDPSQDGCSDPFCNGTVPSSVPKNDGGLCAQQPADLCKEAICFSGTCNEQSKPEGTVAIEGGNNIPTGSGDCRDYLCLGGALVPYPNYLNCADTNPGNCNIRPCDQNGICGTLQGAPPGIPCDSNGDGVIDTVCNGIGTGCP